ncbi:MAG TPA: prepilin-type N-terminal cleavage/methylation domain-containing protein [Holophaga sp.]|nr:prepilin-type N-terminal cleavage/methylation domain-containing protein [Holophaga sp.]
MCATDRASRGFSLVELMVAVAFTAILMAGLATVFRSSATGFAAVNETIGAQRGNRWALEQVREDFSQAGLVFPDRALPAYILSGAEGLFTLALDQTVTGAKRVSDTDPGATQDETVTADVIQFFQDVPLQTRGEWAADTLGNDIPASGVPTSAPTSATVNFQYGAPTDLKANDVMVILDSGENGKWEHPLIAGGANPVVFQTDVTALSRYSLTPPSPGIALAHNAHVPVMFVRPAQLVRYSVQAVGLDPAHPAVRIPCLVRQQADYPTAGTVDWTAVPARIVAENVEGFRIDLSFDGGATWARPRTGTVDWATMRTNANATLATSGLPGLRSITDPLRPDWFRSITCLIRIDITSRTPMRRSEYATTGTTRAYRTRTQTVLVSPRNFAYGT